MSERFTYLPWTRHSSVDEAGLVLRVAGQEVNVPIALIGPGDVVGINPDEILRREPPPGASGFQPNLFPFVEFREPDLPWRLSLGSAGASGRLRPWLALVVVPVDGGESPVVRKPGALLPVIMLNPDQLPPSDEVDLWAHVQLPANPQVSVSEVLATAGSGALARVISPRALKPRTHYVACLVPTFDAGRRAGLGQEVADPRSVVPAWKVDQVTLPVFDHWTFTTADAGDFEALARRLRAVDLSAAARSWQLDVSSIAATSSEQVAPFDTALVPWGWSDSWGSPARPEAADRLRQWLQRAEDASAEVPAVGPPNYGALAAGRGLTQTGWMAGLNLDPRLRAAAALGAEVVRRNQEDLVADAWRQLGDLRRANRERDVAAVAGLVTQRLVTKHLVPLDAASALTVTAPMLARRKNAGNTSTFAEVSSSALPVELLSPAFRKLALTKTGGGTRPLSTLVERMAVRVPARGSLPPAPPELMTVDRARQKLGPLPRRVVERRPAARSIAIDEGVRILQGRTVRRVVESRPRPLALRPLTTAITSDMSDFLSARRRFAARLDLGDIGREISPTAPLMGAPEVLWPLAEPLAAIDSRYLMAGVTMPPDTVGLLQINSAFVVATLVGANDELMRELIWRGAKIDRRATPLRRFFDRRGTDPAVDRSDIPPVSSWVPAETLDSHFGLKDRAVIILRGELIRRFPHSAIHAAAVIKEGVIRKPGPQIKLPLFRGAITNDSVFLGFDLTPEQMRGSGDLGWYVVITEQPAAPRFGLDEAAPDGLTTWNDLSWTDVALVNEYLAAGARIPAPAQPGSLAWNRDAAHMAGITYQRLISLAISAADMLPASLTTRD